MKVTPGSSLAVTLFISDLAHARAESSLLWGTPKSEDLGSSWKSDCWEFVLFCLVGILGDCVPDPSCLFPGAPLGPDDPVAEAHPLAFLLYTWCQLALE